MIRYFICLALTLHLSAFEIPQASTQCIVGIAKDWNSSQVTLQVYQKSGERWQKVGNSWNGRLGKNGLVWGLGLHPNPARATLKTEGDGRTPAGVFRIGGAWGNDSSIRKHDKLPYRRVTSRDLWVEDPASPSYNRHVILPHEPATAWEKKQQMKQNDAAHQLKLFIAHNAPPKVVNGAGSSIFFHIWRNNGSSPSAGCTTMEETRLRALVAGIDPTKQPLYIILPVSDYQKYRAEWRLP